MGPKTFLVFLVFSSVLSAAATSSRVIYGSDDRRDLYQVQNTELLHWARASVALFSSQSLDSSGNVIAPDLGSYMNLCPGEPHREQPTGAFCSGALIAPDLVLTAGHCVEGVRCEDMRLVFDYALTAPGANAWQVSPQKVYGCKNIPYHKNKGGSDFAIVRLDRPVKNREPLKVRWKGQAVIGEDVSVIGYPWGLPMKVADHGAVRHSTRLQFVSNVDTFEGNSGSPVLSAESGEVLGILVAGEADSEKAGSCQKIKRCKNSGCSGESATHISLVLPHLATLLSPPPLVAAQ